MRSRRGLTLLEAMVASGLALFLGLLMVKLLSSGLGAQNKGAQSRDAQTAVRNLLGILVAELRSAAPAPMAEPLALSPVFWPGVWGADQELASADDFYLREQEGTEEAGIEVDSVSNRLLYTRVAEGEADPSGGPLANFALVELFVPMERPNTVERRVHQLAGLNAAVKKGSVKGADQVERNAWLVDTQALDSLPAPEQADVLFDSGPDTKVSFRISHRSFEPVADPGRTRFPEIFDPAVFKVTVAVAIKPHEPAVAQSAWPQKEAWATFREESTELRIPSVRQN